MRYYVEFRLSGLETLPEKLRDRTPEMLVKSQTGRDLVFAGFQEPQTLSDGLKTLWSFLQLERAWIKSALAAGADGQVRCYLGSLEEEIQIDPEGLLVCTKLGVPLSISKKKMKD